MRELPLNVAVRVTEDHIIDGKCNDHHGCAIALALRERFPYHKVVVRGSLVLGLIDAHGYVTRYEAKAVSQMARFIVRFDRIKVTGKERLEHVHPRVFWLRRVDL